LGSAIMQLSPWHLPVYSRLKAGVRTEYLLAGIK
jgi:hypothetical protein